MKKEWKEPLKIPKVTNMLFFSDQENGFAMLRQFVKIQMGTESNVVQIVVIPLLFIVVWVRGDLENTSEKLQKREESR